MDDCDGEPMDGTSRSARVRDSRRLEAAPKFSSACQTAPPSAKTKIGRADASSGEHARVGPIADPPYCPPVPSVRAIFSTRAQS